MFGLSQWTRVCLKLGLLEVKALLTCYKQGNALPRPPFDGAIFLNARLTPSTHWRQRQHGECVQASSLLFGTGSHHKQKPRIALRGGQSTDGPILNNLQLSFKCSIMGLSPLSAMGGDFQDADEEHKEGLQPRADEERR